MPFTEQGVTIISLFRLLSQEHCSEILISILPNESPNMLNPKRTNASIKPISLEHSFGSISL